MYMPMLKFSTFRFSTVTSLMPLVAEVDADGVVVGRVELVGPFPTIQMSDVLPVNEPVSA